MIVKQEFLSLCVRALFICASISSSLHAVIVLQGDPAAAPGQTFSFPIQAHVSDVFGSNFYVACHPTLGSGKEYSLSGISSAATQFSPLTQETTTVNSVDNQPNPLYDAHVQYLALLMKSSSLEIPALVLAGQPTAVYVRDVFYKPNVLSVAEVKDAQGLTTSGIVGLGNMSDSFAVAAVKKNAAAHFGVVGGGLAFQVVDTKLEKQGDREIRSRIFYQVDASTLPPVPGTVRAVPLDITSPALTINGSLTSIDDVVSFHWNEDLKMLYCALSIQTGSGVTDGGCAICRVMAASGSTTKFAAQPIVSLDPTLFPNPQDDNIVGAVGAGQQVSMNAVKTMHTSTNLNYLIVQGGNGDAASTGQTVYALPLVNAPSVPAIHGTIANKLENPNPVVLPHGFKTPVQNVSQMMLVTDAAAQVGGGKLVIGDITEIFVKGDCVFALVAAATAPAQPGIFYSQALFDSTGKIKSWTVWQRTGHTVDPLFGASCDALGDFLTMTGPDIDSIQTVKRTAWSFGSMTDSTPGDKGLPAMLSMQFPKVAGGVQGLRNFSVSTLGFNGISLLVATGLNKVVMVETGNSFTGAYVPYLGDFFADEEVFTDGTITKDLPSVGTEPTVVVVSGGALQQLGPITCSEVTRDGINGTEGRLFVGGTNGLGVLILNDGEGWDATHGLGPNFTGLVTGMSFIKLGSYTFIRALFYDGNFLYVLTDKILDRIDLTLSDFSTGVLSATTLATASALPGAGVRDTMMDFMASGKFALLATSSGLYRVGSGNDITSATSSDDVSWTSVPIVLSVGPVTQLICSTSSMLAQDFANLGGGNVYALNAYVGKNKGQINRFAVADVSASDVDDNTILPLPDYSGAVSVPKLNFNSFRDKIATNGATNCYAVDKNLATAPLVYVAFGFGFGAQVPLDVGSTSRMSSLAPDSATGSLVVAGDSVFDNE